MYKVELRGIVTGGEVWIALVICALVTWRAPGVSSAKVGEVVGTVVAYAAVVLGFSLTGEAIVFTLPNERFVAFLVGLKTHSNKPTGYEQLLFVFVWTVVLHWILVVWSILLLLSYGGDATLLPTHASIEQRISIGVLTFFAVYGLLQFLITAVTVGQMGRVYSSFYSREHRDGDDKNPPAKPK